MSRNNYLVSQKIEAENYPFYALIMAAMRKADSNNAAKLKAAWPDISAELQYRYWSSGGFMPGEDGYSTVGDDNLPVPTPYMPREESDEDAERDAELCDCAPPIQQHHRDTCPYNDEPATPYAVLL